MRTLAAILLVTLLIPAVFAAVTLTAVSSNLTSTAVLGVLHRANVGTLAQSVLTAQLRRMDAKELSGSAGISPADLSTIVTRVLPASQVTAWVDAAVPQAFAWLQGDRETIAIVLDLRSEKQRIRQELARYLNERIDTLPVCAGNQPPASAGTLPTCRPESVPAAALRDQLTGPGSELEHFVASVPDSTDLANLAPAASSLTGKTSRVEAFTNSPELQRARTILRSLRTAVLVAWLLVGVLFLLLVLATHRPLHRTLRWIGGGMFLAGLLPTVLGTALVYGSGSTNLSAESNLSPEVGHALSALIQAEARALGRYPLGFGIALLVLGLVLFIASVLPHHPVARGNGMAR